MKNFGKALKLYLKISFNPLLTIFGTGIIVAMMISVAAFPETPDSDDYMSMIGSAGFGQIGIVVILLMGTVSITRSRFYSSTPFAKTFITVVPLFCTAVAALIYDIIAITIAALCWCEQGLSDLLIIAPINSFIICLAVSCAGKPKLECLYIIPFVVLAWENIFLNNISVTAHGFGLPVPVSAVIGVLIFAAGIAVTLLILNIWWKKCDHIYRGNYNTALNKI